ncbi:hypothetical protein BLNAU_3295 [Blattamonas nauphoetae]|uniref:Uncharacterized protein n=1 Tax=Blattamonas nauphoetae TaxID=2049346 RepID=A0ABQ9YDM3_9EUKA|nr:hypothetical protein BLNAU_3295 [Blattamonas nauphoetae]
MLFEFKILQLVHILELITPATRFEEHKTVLKILGSTCTDYQKRTDSGKIETNQASSGEQKFYPGAPQKTSSASTQLGVEAEMNPTRCHQGRTCSATPVQRVSEGFRSETSINLLTGYDTVRFVETMKLQRKPDLPLHAKGVTKEARSSTPREGSYKGSQIFHSTRRELQRKPDLPLHAKGVTKEARSSTPREGSYKGSQIFHSTRRELQRKPDLPLHAKGVTKEARSSTPREGSYKGSQIFHSTRRELQRKSDLFFHCRDGRVTNDKNYRMARSNFVEITVIRCKVMRRSEVRMGLGGDKDVTKEQAYWACSPQGGASIEESRRWVENRLAGTEVKGMEETERHSSYTLHKIVELKNSRMGEAEVI